MERGHRTAARVRGPHRDRRRHGCSHADEAYRKTAGIAAYAPARNPAEWMTMRDVAKHAGISSHFVCQLIQGGVLPAKQGVPDAPWRIRSTDLDSEAVRAAIARRHLAGRPCEARRDTRTLAIPGT
jgi:hypothetical protein